MRLVDVNEAMCVTFTTMVGVLTSEKIWNEIGVHDYLA